MRVITAANAIPHSVIKQPSNVGVPLVVITLIVFILIAICIAIGVVCILFLPIAVFGVLIFVAYVCCAFFAPIVPIAYAGVIMGDIVKRGNDHQSKSKELILEMLCKENKYFNDEGLSWQISDNFSFIQLNLDFKAN